MNMYAPKCEAVIFDMDGVISDTQTPIARIQSDIFREYGVDMSDREITRRFSGVSNDQICRELFSDLDDDALRSRTDAVFAELQRQMLAIPAPEIVGIPGTRDFIETLRGRGIKCAIGSASSIAFVTHVLESLQSVDLFDVVVSGGDVVRGKPAPDIFLLAAERVSAAPEACVVVEDARSGMIAAREGGMRCIALARGVEKDFPADLIVDDLRNVPLEWLASERV